MTMSSVWWKKGPPDVHIYPSRYEYRLCVPAALLKCSSRETIREDVMKGGMAEWWFNFMRSKLYKCVRCILVAAAGCLALFLSRQKELYVRISKHWHYYSHSRMKTPAIARLRKPHHIGTSAVRVRRSNNRENCVYCWQTTTVRELRADATPSSQSMSPNNFAFIIHFRFSFFRYIFFKFV